MTTQVPSVKLVLLGSIKIRNKIRTVCVLQSEQRTKNTPYIGESSVGKSSIVARYATDTFIEGKEATIGGNTKKNIPWCICVPNSFFLLSRFLGKSMFNWYSRY